MSSSTSPVLSIEGLTVAFQTPGGEATAVQDIALQLYPGETLAVVGESGAGKSTIGAAVTQLIDYGGRIVSGSIRLRGEELIGLDETALCAIRGARIGTIFQNPSTALCPVFSIGTQLIRAIRQHDTISRAAARKRAIELLTRVGIPSPEARLRQYPHEFSGGMKQRVVIAIALACHPEVLIADEPTTALDVSVQSEILALIKDLSRETGSATLLITHNMAVVSEVADRVAVMRAGRLVEIGTRDQVLKQPRQPYTQALIRAVPPFGRRVERFEGLALQEDEKPSRIVEGPPAWFRAAKNESTPDPLLEVRDLSVTFAGRTTLFGAAAESIRAVDDVSFSIAKGEVLGFVGESGSGKSTVARTVAGLNRATSGTIQFRGKDITDLASHPARRADCLDMQMIFQDPYSSLNPRQTIRAALAEPMRVHGLGEPSQLAATIADVLSRVGLDGKAASKLPHQFSGGQRQRIAIARALVMRPTFLICDEPTSALDVSIQAEILNLLRDLQRELGLTMLFISHDLAVIRQVCDRVAVMRRGQLIEQGPTESLFESPREAYTAELMRLTPKFDGHAITPSVHAS